MIKDGKIDTDFRAEEISIKEVRLEDTMKKLVDDIVEMDWLKPMK